MLGIFYFLYPWYRLNVCSKTHVLKPNPQCHVIWRCSLWDTLRSVQFGSIAQSCLTLCNPMDCSTPGFPVHHQLLELSQTDVHPVCDDNHLILGRPLLFLPSIFLIIRVFSKESILHIRLPKYWSFSFSISPSNKYSGLISLRIGLFDLLAVQGTLKSFSNTTVRKHQFFSTQSSL